MTYVRSMAFLLRPRALILGLNCVLRLAALSSQFWVRVLSWAGGQDRAVQSSETLRCRVGMLALNVQDVALWYLI